MNITNFNISENSSKNNDKGREKDKDSIENINDTNYQISKKSKNSSKSTEKVIPYTQGKLLTSHNAHSHNETLEIKSVKKKKKKGK